MSTNTDLSSFERATCQLQSESIGATSRMDERESEGTNENLTNENLNVDNASQNILVIDTNPIIKLSKRRWVILIAMTVFNLCSAFTDTLAPILHTMLDVLDLPMKEYVFIGQSISFIPLISSTPTAWLIDRFGIKVSMFVATGFMFVRNSFWTLLFSPDLPYWNQFKRVYWILAGTAASQVSTIYYTLPLKISELWFGDSERSFAWTILMSSAGIGSSLASFIYPMYVNSVDTVKYLAYINIVCAFVSMMSIFVGMTKAEPKYPTSVRMIKQNSRLISFKSSIKKILCNKDIILQILHSSITTSSFMAVATVFQDILTSTGRSEVFAGSLVSINSIVTLVSIIAFSTLVHRMNDITLTCKLASTLTSVTYIAYLAAILNRSTPNWLIISLLIVYTLAESWKAPNFNNILAHISCGAVSQGALVGFSITGFIITYNSLQFVFVELIKTSSGKPSDYMNSMIFLVATLVLNNLAYLIFFTGKVAKSDHEV